MLFPFQVLNKKKYALCFINAFLENIFKYMMPVVLSLFMTAPFTVDKFYQLIVSIAFLKCMEIMFNVIWNVQVESFLENNKKDLSLAYLKRIYKMSPQRINSVHNGYLKKQIDIAEFETNALLEEIMLSVNGFIVAMSVFLYKLWNQSFKIFALCFLFIAGIVIYNLFLTKMNVSVQQNFNDKFSKYNASSVDFLQNIKIVKNFSAMDYAESTIQDKFKPVQKAVKRVNIFNSLRIDGIHSLVTMMYLLILVSLFMKMKSDGEDVLSYLVFYSSIFNSLNMELKGVAKLFIHYNKFKSACVQIEEMVVEDVEREKIKTWNNITIKDVDFRHDSENDSISIPVFSLDKGDKVSIVGESGQGKSTFLRLFCRQLDINDSHLLCDGTETSQVPDVACISQDSELFDLSIRDNLCLGKPISEELLAQMIESAGLSEWVDSLTDGLDTIVGEKGVKLSVGQKQRLNIIRGILLDREIYIFDEPTSNLDSSSEEKIFKLIDEFLKEKTCIIVTHRPRLIELCNKHYQFQNRTMEKSTEEGISDDSLELFGESAESSDQKPEGLYKKSKVIRSYILLSS